MVKSTCTIVALELSTLVKVSYRRCALSTASRKTKTNLRLRHLKSISLISVSLPVYTVTLEKILIIYLVL